MVLMKVVAAGAIASGLYYGYKHLTSLKSSKCGSNDKKIIFLVTLKSGESGELWRTNSDNDYRLQFDPIDANDQSQDRKVWTECTHQTGIPFFESKYYSYLDGYDCATTLFCDDHNDFKCSFAPNDKVKRDSSLFKWKNQYMWSKKGSSLGFLTDGKGNKILCTTGGSGGSCEVAEFKRVIV